MKTLKSIFDSICEAMLIIAYASVAVMGYAFIKSSVGNLTFAIVFIAVFVSCFISKLIKLKKGDCKNEK